MDHPVFDEANDADRLEESSFARLVASGRPPVDRILLDLAGQFGAVDREWALERLDDLARGLFGIASLSCEDAAAHLIASLRRDGGLAVGAPRVEGLMLDRVLRDRRGHPALLAAVCQEVARRAGRRVSLIAGGRDWFVGFEDADGPLLVALSPFDAPVADGLDLRRLCSRDLAYAVLAELRPLFTALGQRGHLARALRLQEMLLHRDGLRRSLSEEQEG